MADAAHAELPFRSRKPGVRVPAGKRAADVPDQAHARRQRSASVPHGAAPSGSDGEGLVFMVTNIDEEAHGRFHLWGVTTDGRSVLVRVNDFRPYFLIAAPALQGQENNAEALTAEELDTLTHLLNKSIPPDSRIISLTPEQRTPIMFYRPNAPGSIPALKVTLKQGGSLRKASSAVHKALKSDAMSANGFEVCDSNLYEHEVHLLQRFLVDASVSGGAWMYTPRGSSSSSTGDAAAGAAAGFAEAQQRTSNCAVEVEAPWRCMRCLTPDATQLADAEWEPQPPPGLAGGAAEQWRAAAASAAAGDIAALRLLTMDVVLSPSDGKDRVPVPSSDPVVAITCILHGSSDAAISTPGGGQTGQPADILGDEDGLDDNGGEEEGGLQGQSVAEAVPEAGGSIDGAAQRATPGAQEKVVFVYQRGCEAGEAADRVNDARVHRFPTERAMLLAWRAWVQARDPDAFVLFEVKDTLGALQERFRALKIDGGGLPISRLQGTNAKPVSIKKVTQYSANWVRSQSRMSSTSNQETWRADIAGRVVFDLLRQILSTCNLASFSLVDACQSLLGRRLEVLPPSAASAFAGLAPPPPTLDCMPFDAEAGHMRLAAYSATRAGAVFALLGRMSILAESVELARATGLTLANVLYNAQMIRTWSLLLRNAQRQGYMLSGRVDPQQLVESPYLMHPVEAGTVGLYRTPVCVLDFASLYPSLFRAHNLCYTTLLHPDDVGSIPAEDITTTPTGDKFVKPTLRKGVLPSILAALIQARSATKALLKEASDPARRAVLDSRQKALKVSANALYGFTGAQTSMLQCLPLADSCLALGAASTKRAIEVIHQLAEDGKLGPKGTSARVIYGQTDSVFVHLPDCSPAEAVSIGQHAGRLVSEAFPPEMTLQFEKVLSPFLLLHVNRYAGRSFEAEADVAGGRGQLLVKGLKSMWRMAPGILRSTLGGAVRRIILDDNVEAAVAWVEHEVRRLLSGGCELWELIMTGGLWRVTGSQVAAAAEGGGEEMRGPHAALAARLAQRDPGRSFVLGERIQYVLLPGTRLQDDASEDPLTAAKAGATGAAELYWKQKMVPSIKEVFATCLPTPALQELLTGPHTTVREDPAFAGAQAAPPSGRDGGKQTALKSFFRSKVRCLGGCKRTVSSRPDGSQPPLCEFCAAEDGKAAEVWISLTDSINETRERQRLALSTCMRCHSGGMLGPVVCENGECPVMFSRLAATNRLDTLLKARERLDDW